MIELIVDNFAGGGGASYGIELALGRPVDLAINHDLLALVMHKANHRRTLHLCEDVFDIDPVKVAAGRPVGLVWLSPDCRHHSRAKGGKPVDKKIRALAWVAVKWAATVRPRVIILENVPEFLTWGPLNKDNRPCKRRKGKTFRAFVRRLEGEGYRVEWRELRACDYGAPTTRKRLFLIARCDDQPIIWPTPTHGAPDDPQVLAGSMSRWRTAAECIDWSILCPSIFLTPEEVKKAGLKCKRPLCDATMRRIALGMWKFVINAAEPFIVPLTHQGAPRAYGLDEPFRTVTGAHRGEMALVSPTLIQTGYGEREGQKPRVLDLGRPLGTIVAGGAKHALVSALLAKHYGGPNGKQTPGSSLDSPFGVVTTQDHHGLIAATLVRQFGTSNAAAVNAPMGTIMPDGGGKTQLVKAFLTKYYGTAVGAKLDEPAPTITSHDRFGLVTVQGQDYAITDIGIRMLTPRELFRAQGFSDTYIIDPEYNGKSMTKTAQVRMVGNSVSPPVAAAIVSANCADMAVEWGEQVRMFQAGD